MMMSLTFVMPFCGGGKELPLLLLDGGLRQPAGLAEHPNSSTQLPHVKRDDFPASLAAGQVSGPWGPETDYSLPYPWLRRGKQIGRWYHQQQAGPSSYLFASKGGSSCRGPHTAGESNPPHVVGRPEAPLAP